MRKAKILIVDDEKDIREGLETRLCNEGFNVKTLESGEKVIETLKSYMPDLILLDLSLGGMTGFEVKDELNKNIKTETIPVIFLTVDNTIEHQRRGLKSGANDYVVKPFDIEDLIVRINAVLTRKKFYESMYMRDPLTKLFNKSHLEKQAKILYTISKKYSRPFSMAVIDINNLKDINSRFGHDAGDFVLKSMGEIIKTTVRGMDIPIKYTSDEFLILLPETDNSQAVVFIDRVKKNLKKQKFVYNDKTIRFSISAGSATCLAGELGIEDMFRMLDLNMHVKEIEHRKSAKKNVLIIEDEEDIASGVRKELEAQNFTVDGILISFEEAVEYIKTSEKAPDYVILDLVLEEKLSPDLLGQLYSKWDKAKVYLFTAYPEYFDTYPYFRDIVTGVFTKSQLNELVETLQKSH